jgi:hypothetical protein
MNIQLKQEEYVGKDWRTITFSLDHVIQLKKNNHVVFICQRANRGECKHAVCHECHEVFSVKMSWCRLVIMSYAIYSYVLMCGGVPEIIWVDLSGQNVPLGVLSVTGCLLWVISNWGHFVGTHVYWFWTWAYTWYICLNFGLPVAWNSRI